MIQEGEGGAGIPPSIPVAERPKLLLLFICVVLSVFFINSGFLSFLFLAPLGYAALVYSYAWMVFIVAAAANGVFSLFAHLFNHYGFGSLLVNIFYFTILSVCFAYIMRDNKSQNQTVYRFILASVVGALSLLVIFLGSKGDFAAMIKVQAELLASMVAASPSVANGADVVQRSALEQMLTPEKITEIIKNVALRGGALVSALFLFIVNRQIALAAARLFKKQRHENSLPAFFAPPYTIWILSFALAAVMLMRLIKAELPEILAWNVLVICGILFLAQGAGIVMFTLARRTHSFRLFVNVLAIVVIFSPLNTFALAALLLLGIAENWLPFRVPKQDGQASTPGP
ncbi:MAG: YybS family protein [Treponema sp.]|jgi:hypothetical protein|nr:YybS family protein [Treponema sp.]